MKPLWMALGPMFILIMTDRLVFAIAQLTLEGFKSVAEAFPLRFPIRFLMGSPPKR